MGGTNTLNKEEFQKLPLNEQIDYYNEKMLQGESMSKISSVIGISKSVSAKFKEHGYKLIDKQYILQDAQESQSLPLGVTPNPTQSDQKQPKEKKAIVTPKINSLPVDIEIAPQNGRVNSNISLDIELKKELQILGIRNDKTLSDIINEAAATYLKNFK